MIIVPVGSVCGISGHRSYSQAQLYGYTFALESYYYEYGEFPEMFSGKESLSLAEGNNSARFIMVLSGRNSKGERLTDKQRQQYNRKNIPFYSFGQSELAEPDALGFRRIVDGYGNPNIVIHVDHDGDGFVTVPVDGIMTRVEAPVAAYTIGEGDWESVSSYD